MTKTELVSKLNNWDDFARFSEALKSGKSVDILGIDGACADFFVASASYLLAKKSQKVLYITSNDFAARHAYENLCSLMGDRCVLLERSEYMFYNALAKSEESDYRRMKALSRIASGDYDFLIVSVGALIQKLMPLSDFMGADFEIKVKEHYDVTEIAQKLTDMSYVRVPVVDGKREFSLRGDILDVFPTSSENPVRIEFFDDEVDTIRQFNMITQRSVQEIDSVSVTAESEFRMGLGINFSEKEILIKNSAKRTSGRAGNAYANQIIRQVNEDLEYMKAGADFPGRDRYVPFVVGTQTLFEWLDNPLVFAENKRLISEAAEAINDEQIKMCMPLADSLFVPDELYNLYVGKDELERTLSAYQVTYLERFYDDGTDAEKKPKNTEFPFKMKLVGGCAGNDIMISDLMKHWENDGFRVCLFTEKEDRFAKLCEIISQYGSTAGFVPVTGPFSGAFECESMGIAVVSENTFYTHSQRKQTKKKKSVSIDDFSDIKPGDYVVHDVHGIGIFEGIVSRETDGIKKDFAVIRYADNGRLWLPTFQLDSIAKYIGSDDYIPKINTLGGRDFYNQKERVKKELRIYVDELAKLYAQRSTIEGYAYSPDSEWQREFEADFDYEPTDDQVTSTEEIKRDMEQIKPMERLLCGDVGFGKTEVAMRAAFKAILDGKQVAFLCPTTVLAQQHYKTVKARFEKFPVNVDYVCRFRTLKERNDIFKKLKEGKIDLLIGTHSILQNKAEFKELGLIIVDEEQRFGVLQKEKLKMKWPRADILYLSATPIPRTLNMSLSKIRDISLLTDPPKMRNPVQTYVVEYDEVIVKNAIYREMARHGQVFYLFNRVQQIGEKFMKLQELIPEARIAMAHGQMPERELEGVMQAFIDREYDVLLCSAIIESGLDIPNANTIIVENGHTLGLAQLYQIRGRVGRSDQRAYAYITYPKNMEINEDAEKRLQTIKEFTEFGSGFKVALRDLQIRGAGSVLGERQHGEVSGVGYDMYCKLLNDMILEATGEEVPEEEVVINVEIAVDSFIPEDFISDRNLRMDMYKRIAAVTDDADIMALTEEFIDRFGDVPKKVVNLMHLSKMRTLAAKIGVRSVTQIGGKVELTIGKLSVFDDCIKRNHLELAKNYRGRFNVMMGEGRIYAEFTFSSPEASHNQQKVLDEIEKFFETMSEGSR